MKRSHASLLPLFALAFASCGGGGSSGFDASLAARLDKTVPGQIELYATDNNGGQQIPLSGTMAAGGDVTRFAYSPDGARIAFIADKDVDETHELYVVPASSATPVKVSAPLVAGGDVLHFAWAPDGSRLVYFADQDTDDVVEVYTVLPTGASNVKVSGTMPATGDAATDDLSVASTWAPNSTRLAFLADRDVDLQVELYAVDADGTDGAKLNGALPVNGNVAAFAWAPGSARVAYWADQTADDVFEVFSSLPDGTGNVSLSPAVAGAEDASAAPANVTNAWAPDGSRLAYLSDEDAAGTIELFTVLPDGIGHAQASGVLTAGGNVLDFAWAPNGTRIAYRADQDVLAQQELYTSARDGAGGSTKVNGLLVPASPDVTDFRWAPNSNRIAYRADQESEDMFELYTTLPAAPTVSKVSGPLVAAGDVAQNFEWSPDSARVAYLATQNSAAQELFASAAAGGGNIQLSAPLPPGGNVTEFQWTATSVRVVYLADGFTNDKFELFTSPPAGGFIFPVLASNFPAGDVVEFAARPQP